MKDISWLEDPSGRFCVKRKHQGNQMARGPSSRLFLKDRIGSQVPSISITSRKNVEASLEGPSRRFSTVKHNLSLTKAQGNQTVEGSLEKTFFLKDSIGAHFPSISITIRKMLRRFPSDPACASRRTLEALSREATLSETWAPRSCQKCTG